MNQVNLAKTVARMLHRGQTYNGQDYFEAHVEKVVFGLRPLGRKRHERVLNLDVMVAYLHDVVEDTPATLDDLHQLGFDRMVVDSVDALTRRPEETYREYIERVALDRTARMVKMSDLRINLNAGPPKSLADRYRMALALLEDPS